MALTTISGNGSFLFPFSDIPDYFFPVHFQKWFSGCPSFEESWKNKAGEESWRSSGRSKSLAAPGRT